MGFEYKSSNGKTYLLVKSYIKFGNKEPKAVYFFKTKETLKLVHHPCDMPDGWGVMENPKNGYPLICGIPKKGEKK